MLMHPTVEHYKNNRESYHENNLIGVLIAFGRNDTLINRLKYKLLAQCHEYDKDMMNPIMGAISEMSFPFSMAFSTLRSCCAFSLACASAALRCCA